MAFNFPRVLLGIAALASIALLGYYLWDYVLPYFLF